MSYDIQFTDDEERRRIYGKLSEDNVLLLEGALGNLSDDPVKHSRKPPVPYRPIGRMCEVKLRVDGRLHFVQFFFHFDKPTKTIAVRRVVVAPPLEKRSAPDEKIGLGELKDVVDVPASKAR